MFKESQAMKEIHEIREKIYKETKNMSSIEKIEHLNLQGRKTSEYFRSRKKSTE